MLPQKLLSINWSIAFKFKLEQTSQACAKCSQVLAEVYIRWSLFQSSASSWSSLPSKEGRSAPASPSKDFTAFYVLARTAHEMPLLILRAFSCLFYSILQCFPTSSCKPTSKALAEATAAVSSLLGVNFLFNFCRCDKMHGTNNLEEGRIYLASQADIFSV